MASQETEDDVAQATYTARTYPLATGEPADLHEAQISAAMASINLPVNGGNPHITNRDTSLEGAGTAGAGAGYVDPGELKAEMNPARDPEVDNATYVSHSQYLGSSTGSAPDTSSSIPDPSVRPKLSHTATSPHVPGEFPTEIGEDLPATSNTAASGTATSAGGAALQSVPEVAGEDGTPSGLGNYTSDSSAQVPIVTTTNSVEHGTFASPDQAASNAAVDQSKSHELDGGAAAIGALAAVDGAYELEKDHNGGAPSTTAAVTPEAQPAQTLFEPTSTSEPTPGVANLTPIVPEAHDVLASDPEYEHENTPGRDAAIAGGAGAVGGAAAAAAYEDKADQNEPLGTSAIGSASTSAAQPEPIATKAADSEALTQTDAPHEDAQAPHDTFAREAVVAGGAGAGIGAASAYELTDDKSRLPITSSTLDQSSLPQDTQPVSTAAPTTAATSSATAPVPSNDLPSDGDHRYDRDAALAGGAAATGVGAYKLEKNASQDYGSAPHSSNLPENNAVPIAAAPVAAAPIAAERAPVDTAPGNTTAATPDTPKSIKQGGYENDRVSATKFDDDVRRSTERPESSRHSLDEHGNNKVSVDEHGHRKLHKKRVEQIDAHEHHLEEAREHEYEIGGDRGEVKHGIMHKILHPREHKREKQEAEEHRQRVSLEHSRPSTDSPTPL